MLLTGARARGAGSRGPSTTGVAVGGPPDRGPARPRRLLVGLAEAAEVTEPRRYLLELVTGLTGIGVEVQVALFDDGPVAGALAAAGADVLRMPDLRPRTPAGLVQSAARRLSGGLADRVHDTRVVSARRWIRPPDCIHVHGPRAAPVLRFVRTQGVPVTTYAHPWDFSIAGLGPLDLRRLLDRTDRFLAADDSVAADLRAAGADPTRVEPAPAELRFPVAPLPSPARAAARAALGLPAGAVVVAVPPVPDWADFPDLTLAVAWELERRLAGAAPVLWWYGMPGPGDRRWPVEYEIDRTGLRTVLLRDDRPAWEEVVAVADVVLVPSRLGDVVPEDFADVAAHHACPVLTWAGLPGTDAVAAWGGAVVDAGAVGDMAGRLTRLVADPSARLAAREAPWRRTLAEVERLAPLHIPLPGAAP